MDNRRQGEKGEGEKERQNKSVEMRKAGRESERQQPPLQMKDRERACRLEEVEDPFALVEEGEWARIIS